MSNTIDGNDIIARQLSVTETTPVVFKDGRTTTLTPSRCLPAVDDPACRVSLNGTWRAARWPFAVAEEALAAADLDDGSWEAVAQPGKVFYYDPEQSPASIKGWDRVTLAHVDPDDGAVIRRKVVVPGAWRGKRVLLHFDAVYPACRVFCNGVLLGSHMSGLTPVEWDVTELVTPGREATVAVRLLRRHRFVQLDMPRHALEFTGISQDAYLHAVEPVHVVDYHLVTRLDDAFSRGVVEGKVSVAGASKGQTPFTVTLSVFNLRTQEHVVAEPASGQAAPGGVAEVPVAVAVERPDLWNDEYPHLYRVQIRLRVPGHADQVLTYRTGFRRFVVKDGRATLNGRPVKFRGVNHLTFHPEHGMYTPADWLRQCLTLMKRANVNAIRTHFLGPKALAELCDEMGLYLLQELPIDWGTHFIHDPEWVGPGLTRLEGGVRRDRHHPSIMVWSVGNENMPESRAVAEDGWNHLRIYDAFVKRLDPTRPTMFPPPGPANKIKGIFEVRVGDVADTHYSFNLVREFNETHTVTNPRSWEADMETVTRDEAVARGWSGVWFSSEYGIMNMQPDLLNAPYVSIISDTPEDPLSDRNTQQVFTDRLRREWGYMRDDPTCLGGAYFPWLCSGAGNNPWGWVRWGEDADWGVVTADLLPKPAFWALRVLFSPVAFPARLKWRKGQTSIVFRVTNHYNRIDLKDCTLRIMMAGGGRWLGSMREWRDVPVSCAPGQQATVTIPIWNPQTLKALEDGAPVGCRCLLMDPSGFRPITADIVIVPETTVEAETAMPVGPDAVL